MKGKENRVRSGKMINTPPYGYRLAPKKDENEEILVAGDGRVVYERVSDEFEVSIVNRVYEEYVFDGKSMNEVRDALNREEIPTRKGRSWERAMISRILKNPVYTGVLIYNKYYRRKDPLTGKIMFGPNPKDKWIIVPPSETEHKPIISEELFEKAQAIRLSKIRIGSGAVHSDFLFSGLGKCGVCGSKMYRKKVTSYYTRKSDGVTTKSQCNGYQCGRWQRFKDTPKIYVSEQALKEAVLGDLKKYKGNPQALKSFLEESKQRDLEGLVTNLESKRKALSKVDERYDRLLRAYELGHLPLEKFNNATDKLNLEEKQMKADIAHLEVELDDENRKELGRKDFLKAVSEFDKVFKRKNIKAQKSFLRNLIDDVVVHEDKLVINYSIEGGD